MDVNNESVFSYVSNKNFIDQILLAAIHYTFITRVVIMIKTVSWQKRDIHHQINQNISSNLYTTS